MDSRIERCHVSWLRVLLVGLEVLLQHVVGGALLAPVPHHTGGALHHLPGLALLVNLAQTSPLTKLHVGVNLDQGDPVLHAEGSHELLVHRLVTVLGKDTEQSLTLVQGLAGLTESASKAISYQCLLEDFLDGSVNVHGATCHGGSGGDISFNITHVDLLDVPSNLLVQEFAEEAPC